MPATLPIDALNRCGYAILPGVLCDHEAEGLIRSLQTALRTDESKVLRSRGQTYGSRDLATLLPEISELPRRPILKRLIAAVLGPRAGLVRAIYFDKPPERSWSLPWHKDRTIAVQRNDIPTPHFQRPTTKAGIPHVDAPVALLASMLTLRIHLDPMTPNNGPLSVIPGSHLERSDSEATCDAVELHAEIGDVLAMRPLLSHRSSRSAEGNTLHRRVDHLEFAPSPELPDAYEWHSFIPV